MHFFKKRGVKQSDELQKIVNLPLKMLHLSIGPFC